MAGVKARSDKDYYEKHLGQEISDSTWYRVLRNIKSIHPKGEYDKNDLELYAKLRKEYKNLCLNSEDFAILWQKITDFKHGETVEYRGDSFKKYLLRSIPYRLPLATFYSWFQKCNLSFKKDRVYKTKQLMPIICMAQVWFLKKVRDDNSVTEI